MDLSTLDATQPPDTQVVSQGAQRIRETRDATKTSFSLEHSLTGEHMIPSGNTGARPAAGHSGRLYINTQLRRLERDTGSGWTKVQNTTPGSSTLGGTALTTVFQDICGGGRQVDSGGFITCLLIATIETQSLNAGAESLIFRFTTNGAPIIPAWSIDALGLAKHQVTTLHTIVTPVAGVTTFSIQANSTTNGSTTVVNCMFTLIEL